MAAVPVAAPAIITVVIVVKEDEAAPEPAMAAAIAVPVSEHAVTGEVGAMADRAGSAYMAAAIAAASMTATSVTTAADKHKGAMTADGSLRIRRRSSRFCCGDRICDCGIREQGQAESCGCSRYDSFCEHEVPPNGTLANLSKPKFGALPGCGRAI